MDNENKIIMNHKTIDNRGKIIWIDDEIESLKPHILFLKEKGYDITTSSSGKDGLEKISANSFDLVLIDQFMPGLDGMETIIDIKRINPSTPVIMITKSEEEWLMDEAIYKKIDHLLIKPVNPNQIFMACKQILEQGLILSEKSKTEYLSEFQKIEMKADQANSIDDWWGIYSKLVKWQFDFDSQNEESLIGILNDQFKSCNKKFSRFIEQNYSTWLQSSERPTLSCDIFSKHVEPYLKESKKICMVVMDAMRLDQFMELYPLFSEDFNVDIQPSLSLLPSATPFSRNAIFSGMFTDQLCEVYPEQKEEMIKDQGSLNSHEKRFLLDQLSRHGLSEKTLHYHKIWVVSEGQKFLSKINNYTNRDIISIVVNFVDQLAHRRSESDVLKEMVPDETGYRKAVRAWYKNSWIRETLRELKNNDYCVVVTSDHGSVMVNEGSIVKADRNSSSGIRYKFGTNINSSDKSSVDVRNLNEFKLPELGVRSNYLIAKDDYFFFYPNQQRKYTNLLEKSFQHGGISLEEMMVPVFTMHPK